MVLFQIKLKEYSFVRKIETIDDLLPIYRVDNTLTNEKTGTIDFYMPGKSKDKDIKKGLKKHVQNNTTKYKLHCITSVYQLFNSFTYI